MSAFADFAASSVAAAVVGFLVSPQQLQFVNLTLPSQIVVAFNSTYGVNTLGILPCS
jgi:hypothetical protein